MVLVYVLIGLSIISPLYTYCLYPQVLRLLPKRSFRTCGSYFPSVTTIIVSTRSNMLLVAEKVKNVESLKYPKEKNCLVVASSYMDVMEAVRKSNDDIIVITDVFSLLDVNALNNLLIVFNDDNVGCSCGILRKPFDSDGNPTDGSTWKYENRIKELESNLGELSGGNASIMAVRRELFPMHLDSKIAIDFQISTQVTLQRKDVVFCPEAIAFEQRDYSDKDLFKKHIEDGASAYRSIINFWRLLLPRKGSFVYISHRVLKWLVPFNLIILFIGTFILQFSSIFWRTIFIIQVVGYVMILFYHFIFAKKNKTIPGIIGKLISMVHYFLELNLAWFLGLFRII